MRSAATLTLLARLGLPMSMCLGASAIAQPTPAPTPTVAYSYPQVNYDPNFLFKRQDCPAGTYQCTDPGFDNVCCANNQRCARDESNSPACCPTGAVCTGTAPDSPGEAPTAAASFVPNEYFPFPYVPLRMEQDDCYSAVSQCAENYDTCVRELQGDGGNEVIIVVPGGDGTTVAGGDRPDMGTSATPICSSLSSRACYELSNTDCAGPTTVNGVVIEEDSAARPTAPPMMGVAAGLGIAVWAGLR